MEEIFATNKTNKTGANKFLAAGRYDCQILYVGAYICGSWVWNLLYVTLLVRRIFIWL